MQGKADDRNSLSLLSSTQFLMVKELARRYRTSAAVIYRWISENRFPENVILRLGSKILIHRENLEALESQGGELLNSERE